MINNSSTLWQRPYAIAAALTIALLAANLFINPAVFSLQFMPQTLAAFAPFALAAMASTPAILGGGGGIDISVGPVMSLVNIVIVAVLLPSQALDGPVLGIATALVLGMGIGAVNGVLVAALRYQPIIATLCVMLILTGINIRLAPSPKLAGDNWSDAINNSWGPVPVAAIVILAPLGLWALLGKTAWMKNLYSVGGNDTAAFTSGVNVRVVRVIAYTAGGFFAGVGGIALTAILRSGDSTVGMQYTLIAITAVVLGGTSMAGGRGGMAGSIMAASAIFLFQILLSALRVPTPWLNLTYGAMLIGAIIMSVRTSTVAKAKGVT